MAQICLFDKSNQIFTWVAHHWAKLCWPSRVSHLLGCTPWICRPICPISCLYALSLSVPTHATSTSWFAWSWSFILSSPPSLIYPSWFSSSYVFVAGIPSPLPLPVLTAGLLSSFCFYGVFQPLAVLMVLWFWQHKEALASSLSLCPLVFRYRFLWDYRNGLIQERWWLEFLWVCICVWEYRELPMDHQAHQELTVLQVDYRI